MGRHIIGVDLGQAHDYTAISILHDNEEEVRHLRIGHLERVPLGSEYPDIVKYVLGLCDKPKLNGATIVVDKTGVGAPVLDMFNQANAVVVPVTITGGTNVSGDEDSGFHVPKRDLVNAVLTGLQTGELRISKLLKYSKKLIEEVRTFKYKLSAAGHDTYDSVRESAHDDLILSVCLPVWYARQAPPLQIFMGSGPTLSKEGKREAADRILRGFNE